MKDVTTASGFSCRVDEAVFDDMELFDGLSAVSRGDMQPLSMVVDKIMGRDKPRLYEHVRREDGVVPISSVMQEVMEIVTRAGEKNS